ncbi:unnamed protein product, partial [Mesorhabditis spiculigera]
VHNNLRAQIALGKFTAKGVKMPAAADMLKIKWNTTLESSAQAYANKCVFEHSNTTGLGENLYMSWSSAADTIDGKGNKSATAWANEFQEFATTPTTQRSGKTDARMSGGGWPGVLSASRFLPFAGILLLCITLLLWLHEVQNDRIVFLPHGMRFADDTDKRILVASLTACGVSGGGGVGNVVFELISFLGIARKLYRTPAIYSDNDVCLKKLVEFSEYMPNLLEGFLVLKKQLIWPYPSKYPTHECFEYFDPVETFSSVQHLRVVNTQLNYLQNLRFFEDMVGTEELKRRLAFSPQLLDVARLAMYTKKQSEYTHNICIHIRRGDFLKEDFHLESEADFTLDATKYIMKKMRKRGYEQLHIYILGQDGAWTRELFANETLPRDARISVIHSPSYLPSMVDWGFAHLYCDTTLLTASISTYGYWLAMLSRGQDVFYRTRFSKGSSSRSSKLAGNVILPHGMRFADDTDKRILVASLRACGFSGGGGVGNVVFELISFLQIARKLDRTPAIYPSNKHCMRKLREISKYMPNLLEGFLVLEEQKAMPYPSINARRRSRDYFDPLELFGSVQQTPIVATAFQYLQNIRFFEDLLGTAELERRLAFSAELLEIAGRPGRRPESNNTLNLCVHIRRGDFLGAPFPLESQANFTITATKQILERLLDRGHRQLHIYVIGRDGPWQKQLFANESFPDGVGISVLDSPKSLPSMVDWGFSHMYCDTTLLTASSSTYGYWLAMVSRGQDVFYRTRFSKRESKTPVNLWPDSWTAIDY